MATTTSDSALHDTVRGMFIDSFMQSAVAAMTKLNIPDILDATGQQSKSCADLAKEVNGYEPHLYRVLRAAAAAGYLKELPDRHFALTPLGACLRADDPSQLKYNVHINFFGAHLMGRAYLDAAAKAPVYGFAAWQKDVYGDKAYTNPWDYLSAAEHQTEGAEFNRYMTTINVESAPLVAAAYDFGRHSKVADCGGGQGLLLSAILRAHKGIKEGMVLDLPHVVDGAPPVPKDLEGRMGLVKADFFKPFPAEAADTECFVMQHILHDWNDDESVTILGNLVKSLHPDGRVVIVESVVPPLEERTYQEGHPPPADIVKDIVMLSVCSGKERTADEWKAVFDRAGMEMESCTPTNTAYKLQVMCLKRK